MITTIVITVLAFAACVVADRAWEDHIGCGCKLPTKQRASYLKRVK